MRFGSSSSASRTDQTEVKVGPFFFFLTCIQSSCTVLRLGHTDIPGSCKAYLKSKKNIEGLQLQLNQDHASNHGGEGREA